MTKETPEPKKRTRTERPKAMWVAEVPEEGNALRLVREVAGLTEFDAFMKTAADRTKAYVAITMHGTPKRQEIEEVVKVVDAV